MACSHIGDLVILVVLAYVLTSTGQRKSQSISFYSSSIRCPPARILSSLTIARERRRLTAHYSQTAQDGALGYALTTASASSIAGLHPSPPAAASFSQTFTSLSSALITSLISARGPFSLSLQPFRHCPNHGAASHIKLILFFSSQQTSWIKRDYGSADEHFLLLDCPQSPVR